MPWHEEQILSAHAVMILERVMGIPDLKTPHPPAFAYPDGSLHYSTPGARDALQCEFAASEVAMYVALSAGRTLALFPTGCSYSLYYPAAYENTLGEVGFFFGRGIAAPVSQEDFQNPVSVVVRFKRTPKPKERQRYLQYVRTWAKSVGSHGIAGEGPARLAGDGHIGFAQRWAWFDVDTTGSGPHTMNWLALVHLNFGIEVCPVAEIQFNTPRQWDPRYSRNLWQCAETVDLWGKPTSAGVAVQPEADRSAREESPVAEESYCWSYGDLIGMQTPFAVEFKSEAEWDSLEFTIRFSANATNDERSLLAKFIRSWINLACRGAFGGKGIPCHERPRFARDGRTLTFRVDMRGAEEVASLQALFRGLTYIHAHAPLEFVCVR